MATSYDKVLKGDSIPKIRNWAKGKFNVNLYNLSLPVSSWVGTESPYTQNIEVSGTTTKSKIDIQMDSTTLTQMIEDGTGAIYIANNNKVLTVYAIGEKPSKDLSIQVTRTELA